MKEYSYTSTPPVGRTACTEPQCLYNGALYLYLVRRVFTVYICVYMKEMTSQCNKKGSDVV